LQKAFPLYISAAEAYSHLLANGATPAHERESIKKRWRLILERAEKVKKRIEDLGGQVGKVEISDEAEENAILRRSGHVNGLDLELWKEPSRRDFDGEAYKEARQPDMPNVDVEWKQPSDDAWEALIPEDEIWTVKQGSGADCSVSAGLGVCLAHNRRWRTRVSYLITGSELSLHS
jgi:calpain-7